MTEQRFRTYRRAILNRLIRHAACCGHMDSYQLLMRAVQGRATVADRMVIVGMSPRDPDYWKYSSIRARRLFEHETEAA